MTLPPPTRTNLSSVVGGGDALELLMHPDALDALAAAPDVELLKVQLIGHLRVLGWEEELGRPPTATCWAERLLVTGEPPPQLDVAAWFDPRPA